MDRAAATRSGGSSVLEGSPLRRGTQEQVLCRGPGLSPGTQRGAGARARPATHGLPIRATPCGVSIAGGSSSGARSPTRRSGRSARPWSCASSVARAGRAPVAGAIAVLADRPRGDGGDDGRQAGPATGHDALDRARAAAEALDRAANEGMGTALGALGSALEATRRCTMEMAGPDEDVGADVRSAPDELAELAARSTGEAVDQERCRTAIGQADHRGRHLRVRRRAGRPQSSSATAPARRPATRRRSGRRGRPRSRGGGRRPDRRGSVGSGPRRRGVRGLLSGST